MTYVRFLISIPVVFFLLALSLVTRGNVRRRMVGRIDRAMTWGVS